MKNIISWHQWLLSITLVLAYLQGAWADDDDDGGVDNDNLLHNYGFTDVDGAVPDGWTLIGAGEIVATLVNNIASTQAMSLESRDQSNPSLFYQAINGTRNTAYSVTFWGYRNTTTQSTSTGNYNLTMSFGQGSWSIDPPVGRWEKYSFNGTGIGSGDKLQWSGYDVTGAHLVIGYPCYFLTEGGDDDEPNTTTHPGATGPTSIADSLSATSHMSKTQKIGAIVGGVVGGLILIAAIVVFLLWRRKKNNNKPVKISTNGPPTPEEEAKFIAQPYEANEAPWAIPASPPAHTAPIIFQDPTHPSVTTTSPVQTMSNLPDQASTSVYGAAAAAVTRSNSAHPVDTSTRPTSSTIAPSIDGAFPYAASSPAPTFRSLPPEYGSSASRSLSTTSRGTPQGVPLQSISTLLTVDDEVGRWAADHRSSISMDLEHKLRNAHYRPSDDPKEISDSVWNQQYGVGHFELKRIQELYDESNNIKAKEMHGSGQGGAAWRPSEATQ